MSSFFENLERIVGSANISLGPASVGENTFAVSPGTPAEVSEIVRLCWQENASMIPMGAGVKAAPTDGISLPCVFIDLKRLKHVTNLDEVSLVVHVQAGMRGQDLELLLQRRGLSLGDYSPLALESTIGGLLSVRTAGKSTRRHGFFEDAVLGLSAVLPTGRSIHTRIAPRRATGPDLAASPLRKRRNTWNNYLRSSANSQATGSALPLRSQTADGWQTLSIQFACSCERKLSLPQCGSTTVLD